jgi:hypothetical protein
MPDHVEEMHETDEVVVKPNIVREEPVVEETNEMMAETATEETDESA